MTTWRLRVGGAVAALVSAAALLVVLPGTAAAGPCGTAGCSRVVNEDDLWVTARLDWTCDWGTTGSESPDCGGGANYYVSGGGGHTPYGEDWDTLQVDAGWCYRVRLVSWWGKTWTMRYDRIGISRPTFVKVEDGSRAIVEDQSSTSCP